ncbi:unnamed protein product, partial [Ilex paraguariensis]
MDSEAQVAAKDLMDIKISLSAKPKKSPDLGEKREIIEEVLSGVFSTTKKWRRRHKVSLATFLSNPLEVNKGKQKQGYAGGAMGTDLEVILQKRSN